MRPTRGALALGCGDQVSANVESAVIARLQHWLLEESDQFARVKCCEPMEREGCVACPSTKAQRVDSGED
jgi:hypothetical protein